jgi:hypothetical protein
VSTLVGVCMQSQYVCFLVYNCFMFFFFACPLFRRGRFASCTTTADGLPTDLRLNLLCAWECLECTCRSFFVTFVRERCVAATAHNNADEKTFLVCESKEGEGGRERDLVITAE